MPLLQLNRLTASIVLLLLLMVSGGACSVSPPSPAEQIARGDTLYQHYCAACHDVERGIGPRLTQKVLVTRMTALSLYQYTRRNMPYQAGNTLTEDQYWDITAYLLARYHFAKPPVFLDDETASTIKLVE